MKKVLLFLGLKAMEVTIFIFGWCLALPLSWWVCDLFPFSTIGRDSSWISTYVLPNFVLLLACMFILAVSIILYGWGQANWQWVKRIIEK